MRDVLEARSGVISGRLTCGWIDGDGAVHQDFIVEEMSGVEEDLLAGSGPVVPRLNRVILNCLAQLGALSEKSDLAKAVNDLTATDRMLLLVSIRRASLGDMYRTKIKCPSCSEESHVALDLSSLETREMSDPKKREFESELSSGKVVKWHVMTGADEAWLQTQRKRSRSEGDLITLAMLSRVDEVDGEPLDREKQLRRAIDCVKSMKARERVELRNLFTEVEGFVDTNVEYECPKCLSEFRGDLDAAQPGFFFPQDTQRH